MKTALGFAVALLTAGAPFALASSLGVSSNDQPGAIFFMIGSSNPSKANQGYLGISVRDIAPEQLSALKLHDARGAEIILVDHDAPAGKAGLREHDVVLMMNGQSVEGQEQIRRMLRESPPGKTIVLIISRDGQQMTISAQMAVSQEQVAREASEQHYKVTDPSSASTDSPDFSQSSSPMRGNSFIGAISMNPSYTGAVLEKISSQLADFFGVPNGAGLLVRSVVDDSPAELAGLHAGDVILRADAKPVSSTSDWAKAIKNSHGRPIAVTVMRDKREQTVTLTPDNKKRSSMRPGPEQTDSTAVARLGLSFVPRS